MTDLTAIKTPFGLLDEVYGPGTQEALKAHGGPTEIWTSLGWQENSNPGWFDLVLAYRVKPAPPKPREWWITGGNTAWDTYTEACNASDLGEKPVHVREVLP